MYMNHAIITTLFPQLVSQHKKALGSANEVKNNREPAGQSGPLNTTPFSQTHYLLAPIIKGSQRRT